MPREDYNLLIYVLTGALGGIIVYWSTEISKIFNVTNKFWIFVFPLIIALSLFAVFALVYLLVKKKFSREEKRKVRRRIKKKLEV